MPARLGRYAVRRRLGAGAFATVWLAYDEQLDSPVAVKVLADNWTEDQAVRQRFLEEGRFLRKVESPYVVTVYDAGEIDDGRPYLVMSYADQGTLADRLEIDGLTPGQALEVVRQVGAGLQTLHERGVLHRDLKPANVLFRAVDGEVRAMVADLGLGKSMEVSSRLTVIAGTPSFVSPEQAQGEPLDPRSDLYSLAALTYLLLAGRAAFSHATLSAAARPGSPPALSSPDRPYPDEVGAVVARGLAVERDERWPDVASYVAALTSALAPVTSGAASQLPLDPHLTQTGAPPSMLADDASLPPPRLPRRRRWLRRVVGGVVALAVIAGGAVLGYRIGHEEPTEATVTDTSGYLTVTVPSSWDHAVADDGWRPKGSDTDQPALSVGTSGDWSTDPDGQGVFVGILPGTELPDHVPGHPECATSQDPIEATDSLTVTFTGCGDTDAVVVERVVQLTENRLLWVQVRSASTAVANRVLDDVETHGFG
ncbi:serine/threonine-protein kinase [Nocardioides mangrovi]|uniref:non-specific serine/threonine protein kinase n=1 Tax=Nocardioides mangrovi TaxID=2874580 RepID=A0ABS7UAS5_9ACTN|nr:serine/threonine-protein kinase [Nocardioides mangrovi]MBZ5737970.1 serine/threonine protein kinase [Nocardioides mangrovi]